MLFRTRCFNGAKSAENLLAKYSRRRGNFPRSILPAKRGMLASILQQDIQGPRRKPGRQYFVARSVSEGDKMRIQKQMHDHGGTEEHGAARRRKCKYAHRCPQIDTENTNQISAFVLTVSNCGLYFAFAFHRCASLRILCCA